MNNAIGQTNEHGMAGRTIAIFIQSLTFGGAERAAINLAKGLLENDIQVDLLLADRSGGLLSQVPPQVTIVDLKGKRVLFSLFALMRYLRSHHPDLLLGIQTHTSLIAVWAAMLARIHIPLVISEHTILSVSHADLIIHS